MKRICLFFLFFFLLDAVVLAQEQQEIPVPFTPQAPDANWAEPWKNACEETSIIMVDNFYEGDDLSRDEAKNEILEVLKTKEETFFRSEDESLELILDIIQTLDLGWTGEIRENPDIEEMKNELSAKRPIIIPVYAPFLKNPFYEGGGPDYHVLVLVGFDDTSSEFLVHDPGTKNGEDLRFSYETIMNAIHDWDAEDLTKGRKAVLYTRYKKRIWSFLKNEITRTEIPPRNIKKYILPSALFIGGAGGLIWYASKSFHSFQ